MTPEEHYREAEKLLKAAADDAVDDHLSSSLIALALAQVHATLAMGREPEPDVLAPPLGYP